MAQTVLLKKTSLPVAVNRTGIRITAPSLEGSVTWHPPEEHERIMAAVAAPDPVQQAIAEAQLEDQGSLEVQADVPARKPALGLAPGELAPNEIALETPAVPGQAQFAIFRDESGIISLHFPEKPAAIAATPTGASPANHYRIKLRQTPARPHLRAAMLGGIAGKVIRFVGRSVLHIVGDAILLAAKAWEDHYRSAQGFHSGADFAALLGDPPVPFTNWQSLQGQRSLLFIHGTTSTSAGAFSGLLNFSQQMQTLYSRYGNRVLGFNHHTLTKNVAQNVEDILTQVPPGDYEFDLITHSRGGLVGRTLKTLRLGRAWSAPHGVNLQIGKVALVGTPDVGTPLADPRDLRKALSRLASVETSIPQAAALAGLGAIFAIAGGLVAGGVGSLPGLEDMNPSSAFLTQLNAAGAVTDYFGIQAEYAATGSLAQAIEDDGTEALFLGAANDLVVPTIGVSEVNSTTLPAAQTLAYSKTANPEVCHLTYFYQQKTAEALAAFLA